MEMPVWCVPFPSLLRQLADSLLLKERPFPEILFSFVIQNKILSLNKYENIKIHRPYIIKT